MKSYMLAAAFWWTAVGIPIAMADVFSGPFASQVVFYAGRPGEDPIRALGAPDQGSVELDGGSTTLRFPSGGQPWDYTAGAAIPAGTDLIVIDVVPGDLRPIACFGYDSGPADNNNDGRPDAGLLQAVLLGSSPLGPTYWDNDNGADILYFSMGAGFHGVTSDFYVAVCDAVGGNFDLNAVQVVPAPGAVMIFAGGAILTCRRHRGQGGA